MFGADDVLDEQRPRPKNAAASHAKNAAASHAASRADGVASHAARVAGPVGAARTARRPSASAGVRRAARAMSATTSSPCGPNKRWAGSSSATRRRRQARVFGRWLAVMVRPTGTTRNRRAGQEKPVQSVSTVATEKYVAASSRVIFVAGCSITSPDSNAAA